VIEAPVGDPTVRLADGSTIRVAREAVMLEEAPVPATAPLVVQISRWDRLKDPIGVLTGFATEVPLDTGAHLVLAGPQVDTVSDDPEGAEVLAEVSTAWQGLLPHDRARTHLASLPVHDLTENAVVVNALQRRADVVVQKSVAEGFGLTVTEAMWKERPVVGSRLGGIAEQIEHGKSGLLVDPADLTAFGEALSMLLRDEQFAAEIGHGARQRVRSRFLAPHYLSAHLELALRVAGVADP
jgi:trehalose synthase